MNFSALNDDVQFIISKHLVADLKIRQLLSKNHDLQEVLFIFNEVVYNNDFCKYLKLDYNATENDDYKNAKIFKIHEDHSNTRDVVYY